MQCHRSLYRPNWVGDRRERPDLLSVNSTTMFNRQVSRVKVLSNWVSDWSLTEEMASCIPKGGFVWRSAICHCCDFRVCCLSLCAVSQTFGTNWTPVSSLIQSPLGKKSSSSAYMKEEIGRFFWFFSETFQHDSVVNGGIKTLNHLCWARATWKWEANAALFVVQNLLFLHVDKMDTLLAGLWFQCSSGTL